MTEFVRTAEENFHDLSDFRYEPSYHAWQDLRMHYVDVGPRDAPVMLLLHGMPTWAYLYREMIPPLVAAGFRCIAPDHMGFGRSDKPTDIHWYTIARHTEIMTSLIGALDLDRITVVCQDWGGPIGLAQAAMMPERFEHLVIMNTWLHHPGYEYSEAIRNWNRNWHEGGMFDRPEPDVGMLLVLSDGLADRKTVFGAIAGGQDPGLGTTIAGISRYDAGYNGMRRFPLSIRSVAPTTATPKPIRCNRTLLGWQKGVHFIWGASTTWEEWGHLGERRFDGIATPTTSSSSHGARIAERSSTSTSTTQGVLRLMAGFSTAPRKHLFSLIGGSPNAPSDPGP